MPADFPRELIDFVPYRHNPVFQARGSGHWDVKHRERGWILREGNVWRMWYTGYDGERTGQKKLGYAVSSDGLHWTPHPDNPLYSADWVEDMQVVYQGNKYWMFAEGRDDVAQLLTSPDGLSWQRVGPLDIRMKNGEAISAGPRGTPAAYFEDGLWRLFYERKDLGVWLATSRDMQVWTNVSDDPVLALGPEAYDQHAVAMNQVLKYQGQYYAYYHASDSDQPGRKWSSCIARSADLVTWHKYDKNPILRDNKSSNIVVDDGQGRFRLYTMHDVVQAHFSAG